MVPQRPVEQEEPATETAAASKCEVKTVQARPGRIGCRIGDRIPCYALFIDPEQCRVGTTQAEARPSGSKRPAKSS